MKNIKTGFLIGVICLFLFSCETKENIKITGYIEDYPDSTMVVLGNATLGKPIDTTYLKNQEFSFAIPKMDTIVGRVIIGDEEMATFFMEDSDISIKGQRGDFKYSKIKGGEIQEQANTFYSRIESYSRRFDKVNAEAFEAFDKKETITVDSLNKVLDTIIQKRIEIGSDYIANNPQNYYSLYLLGNFKAGLPANKIEKLYTGLDNNIKQLKEGEIIHSFLEKNKLKVGAIAPRFELKDISGEKFNLSDFKGKYVLIDFWASWCAPCRIENKNLLTNYKKYKDQGFEIIGITHDKNEKNWLKATKKDSIIWTNLTDRMDENDRVALDYNVVAIPSNFLIDPNGRIIGKDIKGKDLSEKLDEIYK